MDLVTRFTTILGIHLLLAALALCPVARPAHAEDPLPSWQEGKAKAALLEFVAAVTTTGGPGFVPPAERVAVFDNDGTLWAEQPIYVQAFFVFDRIRALAPQHPEWKTTEPYRSALAGDLKGLAAAGEKGLMELMAATHTGMTTDEFAAIAAAWIEGARHPETKKLYTELVYQPMLELLAHLRANGFATYIVSGGGQEFMRPWTERVYGIPPERVIGSHGELKFETRNGQPALLKEPKVALIDDHAGKVVGIQRFIGRRPILAFGNSDGDQEMLQWTAAGGGRRFLGLVHHTDSSREWAYDRKSTVGRLDAALDEAKARGWTIVDMKRDWKRVFAFE